MANLKYDKEITALLVIDPYNDFISEGVLNAARKAELRVFYALHRRYRFGDYESWKYIAPVQKAAWLHKAFEYGTWGGEIRREFGPQPGEIVAHEHWGSSGFANTDLDLQLKKHGIHQLIVIGLIAHTCVEATVRYAAELGYEVTMVKDATADYGDEEMHAALDINIPNYASAMVTTDEVVEAMSSLSTVEISVGALIRSSMCFRQRGVQLTPVSGSLCSSSNAAFVQFTEERTQ
jgi:nicotinamidase-related amidase